MQAITTVGVDIAKSVFQVHGVDAADRIAIPQYTLDFIAERVWPRSSLIISDEALSSETGKNTEFVVILSGEPQGGLKHRRPSPRIGAGYGYGQYWSRF